MGGVLFFQKTLYFLKIHAEIFTMKNEVSQIFKIIREGIDGRIVEINMALKLPSLVWVDGRFFPAFVYV